MKRRQFFFLAGTVAMVSSCEKNLPVIIIGAGLAGLSAGQHLLSTSSMPVIVLEARGRLGGRTWTSNLWNIPLDLGASWIHGTQDNPVTDLAKRAGANLVTTSTELYKLYPEGATWTELENEVIEALSSKPPKDRSVQELIEQKLNWQDRSVQERKIIESILQSVLETQYGGSARELSALYFDADLQYQGDEAIFVDGYQTIVNFLAQGLDVRLNHVVTEIDWSASDVIVKTNRGQFQARAVIVTLPLGVLKSNRVKFYPPLPSTKQNAIDRLGMGVLNKCYLRFTEVFWAKDIDWLLQVSPGWTEWVSLARVLNQPILLGFNGGDRGRAIEELTDQEVVESALANLRRMLGKNIPDPVGFQLTRWGKDPYAFGSYSFNPVGYVSQMRQDLQNSLDSKLFFAGEATSVDFFGTAHGAIKSGRKAAQELENL